VSRKYFGTDGVRGRTGELPITPEWVLRLGWAAGRVLSDNGRGRVVIGKDTRVSGYMLESALEAGLSAAGMDILLLGPMPTPGIAYLTRTLHAQAGIVISASHNPYYDNGIKFFSAGGTKLSDEIEHHIEAEIDAPFQMADAADLGKASRVLDAAGRYIEFCKHSIPVSLTLQGIKVALDCAHGATYQVAPATLTEMGASVESIGIDPDGFNINLDCGSTYPKQLQDLVIRSGADIGIALDGDGDRVLLVDEQGGLVDGDEILYIIAAARKAQGNMRGGVAGTLMSNLGLEQALAGLDIDFCRANVGDRYVIEQLHARDWQLGGENSGHVICLDRTTTGDGMITALQVLRIMVESGRSLRELRQGMTKYPQRLVNVKLPKRVVLEEYPAVQSGVAEVEQELGDRGRVLLRLSGTEPLVRVMVEGDDDAMVTRVSDYLADVVREAVSD
jgi:phosphoglucosamine mutase